LVQVDSFSDSNSVGIIHAENEDSVLADAGSLLFAVADGVGGYEGAKIASRMAVEKLSEYNEKIKDEASLRAEIQQIHAEITKKAKELGILGMGTTIAAAKVVTDSKHQKLMCANVGDSPIFLIRDEDVIPLYFDDSERLRDSGNMWTLLSYLGFGPEKITVHTSSAEFEKGDILILCSDGVSDNILGPENDLESLGRLARETRSAEAIVRTAMEKHFKPDDMSAILVFL
jgi:PPM family protein phosphatase